MVLRIAMGLGFVVVLLYGGARFVLPRLQGLAGAARSEIDVVARATLGGRRAVVLVRTRGRTYLVGVTDHAISLIDEVDGRSRSAVDPSRDVVDAVRGGVR
jgi:flagellar biogenesis protein FliO